MRKILSVAMMGLFLTFVPACSFTMGAPAPEHGSTASTNQTEGTSDPIVRVPPRLVEVHRDLKVAAVRLLKGARVRLKEDPREAPPQAGQVHQVRNLLWKFKRRFVMRWRRPKCRK